MQPLISPLILRFRWHFEGSRGTNRIDKVSRNLSFILISQADHRRHKKPEYPLSHILNLVSAHERFIREEIQDLLDQNGFSNVDAMVRTLSLTLEHC